ncbi:DUF2905 family protein [Mesorhizobium sp. A623]
MMRQNGRLDFSCHSPQERLEFIPVFLLTADVLAPVDADVFRVAQMIGHLDYRCFNLAVASECHLVEVVFPVRILTLVVNDADDATFESFIARLFLRQFFKLIGIVRIGCIECAPIFGLFLVIISGLFLVIKDVLNHLAGDIRNRRGNSGIRSPTMSRIVLSGGHQVVQVTGFQRCHHAVHDAAFVFSAF